jgi:2-polyprenyl-3-methyl-5-hydroxy-6-metoxy-1,4-benzoquinol methylase
VSAPSYPRPRDYATHYRDRRFTTGTGPATHRAEESAIAGLLATGPLHRGPAHVGPWLDVPAGAGRFLPLLASLGDVVQLDLVPDMLRAARAVHAGPSTRPPQCVAGDARALPFRDQTFAGALCMRLFQHLPAPADRVACLAELRRVTRGPILLSFFHAWSLQHARRVLHRVLARLTGRRHSRRHAITLATLAAEAAAAGLVVTRTRPLLRFVSEQWIVELLPAR